MDDHIDLVAKMKNEPIEEDEYPEVMQELVVDGYEVSTDEMSELEVESTDLGILGNVIKSYDRLSAEANTPEHVEFMLGDTQYSYVVTVKRIDKPLIVDKKNHHVNTAETTKKNNENVGNIKQIKEATVLLPSKRNVPTTKDGILTEDDSIIIETDNDLNDSRSVEDLENDPLAENAEITLEDGDECLSEGDEELMNRLDNNELSFNDDVNNASSDSEIIYPSVVMETSPEMTPVDKNKSKERSKYKCDQCQFMTARFDRLMNHVENKHEKIKRRKLVQNETPDENDIGGKEIVISEENCDENSQEEVGTGNDAPKKKTEKTKRVRKRDKALKEFLELLNNGTKMIEPFCRKSNEDETNVNEEPESDQSHKCPFCDFTCNNQTAVYRHIGLHHAHNPNEHYKKGKLRTDCVFCPFKGMNRKSLLLHLRTKHRGGKGFQCDQCDYQTHHKSNFDRHVEVVHDKKKDVKCPECGFLTTRNYLLEKHILYKHKGIKPYRCPEPGCNFGSTSSSNRKAHVMEVHRGIRPHACPVDSCEFATSRKFILKGHMYKEHGIGEPPEKTRKKVKGGQEVKVLYSCPHCPHKSAQKGNLQKHIRIKHLGQLKRFKCAKCSYSASEKCFVKTHISEVHLGQYPYSCHLCKFKCSVRQRFERHFSAVHMGERPYHCESCSYKASQPIHLQRHIEVIHKGEKPHFCAYCKFNTAHRANLRAHLKAIHRISEDQLKEVLLSCVDLRVNKKRGSVYQDIEETDCTDQLESVEEDNFELQQEIIAVPESSTTPVELISGEDHQHATVVTVPGVVTVSSIANHRVDNVDDLEALEASLVLEKIGQHQSLAIADGDNVSMVDVTAIQHVSMEHQRAKTKLIRPKVVQQRQIVTPNIRRVYVSKQQAKKETTSQETPKLVRVINTNIKSVNSR